ncbi:hypothetical protein B296_00052601 [Ensete ventricosum]|uniref:Uncharacterized protein n=1 Tax=Ensete ventricosum TaxID=4639 RepID=A0A426XT05_ENSVE|nr:hypothetical protein B296_00052601 [Ensete ventricosum]
MLCSLLPPLRPLPPPPGPHLHARCMCQRHLWKLLLRACPACRILASGEEQRETGAEDALAHRLGRTDRPDHPRGLPPCRSTAQDPSENHDDLVQYGRDDIERRRTVGWAGSKIGDWSQEGSGIGRLLKGVGEARCETRRGRGKGRRSTSSFPNTSVLLFIVFYATKTNIWPLFLGIWEGWSNGVDARGRSRASRRLLGMGTAQKRVTSLLSLEMARRRRALTRLGAPIVFVHIFIGIMRILRVL